jgi:hypothetical protein
MFFDALSAPRTTCTLMRHLPQRFAGGREPAGVVAHGVDVRMGHRAERTVDEDTAAGVRRDHGRRACCGVEKPAAHTLRSPATATPSAGTGPSARTSAIGCPAGLDAEPVEGPAQSRRPRRRPGASKAATDLAAESGTPNRDSTHTSRPTGTGIRTDS